MVYSNHFVLSVFVGNQVQQELSNGTVLLRFGDQFFLRFRNKNSRRALVKFTIDGEDVSGPGYIIGAYDYVDIKRHHNKDAAFRFVSIDSPAAVEFGKNGPNDDKIKGTIVANFFLEKQAVPVVTPRPPFQSPHPWTRRRRITKFSMNDNVYDDGHYIKNTTTSYGAAESLLSSMPQNMAHPCGEETTSIVPTSVPLDNIEALDGCTVEGNMTGQSFKQVYFDAESTSTTLRLFLQGYVAGETQNPSSIVYGNDQVSNNYCMNCGAKRFNKANFCSNCGMKL